jgi:hypothetical protein
MQLVPKEPDVDNECDWMWNGKLVAPSAGQPVMFATSGVYVLPIDPVVGSSELNESSGLRTSRWEFESKELLAFAAQLLERSTLWTTGLPHIESTKTFPYQFEGMVI